MITQELLSNEQRLGKLISSEQIEVLKALTPEQVQAVTALSEKDEKTVIDAKTKDIHDQYDRDMERITGQKKPDNTKSYEYMKSVYNQLKDDLKDAQEKVTDLETQVSNGSNDKALKKQLADAKQELLDKEGELKALQTRYDTESNEWGEKIQTLEQEVNTTNMRVSFSKSLDGVNFKTTIPKDDRDQALEFAQSKIMSQYTRDVVKQDGQDMVVLRDKDGQILRNPDNSNQPFTPGELLLKEVGWMVDKGRQQGGGGVQGGAGSGQAGGGSAGGLDLSGVTNEVEADKRIYKYLMTKEGLTKGSEEFGSRVKELRQEHNVAELPTKAPVT